MNRVELQVLSELRLREARSLLAGGFPDGAYYLAGYSVECALKACIAKRTREHDFPAKPESVKEIYTHDLTKLLKESGLKPLLEVAYRSNLVLKARWDIVQRWSEQSRYERRDTSAADAIIKAIEDDPGGILPWIKLHW
jgi:HEPN domain-containing protein